MFKIITETEGIVVMAVRVAEAQNPQNQARSRRKHILALEFTNRSEVNQRVLKSKLCPPFFQLIWGVNITASSTHVSTYGSSIEILSVVLAHPSHLRAIDIGE
jgi:hypothetical protein